MFVVRAVAVEHWPQLASKAEELARAWSVQGWKRALVLVEDPSSPSSASEEVAAESGAQRTSALGQELERAFPLPSHEP